MHTHFAHINLSTLPCDFYCNTFWLFLIIGWDLSPSMSIEIIILHNSFIFSIYYTVGYMNHFNIYKLKQHYCPLSMQIMKYKVHPTPLRRHGDVTSASLSVGYKSKITIGEKRKKRFYTEKQCFFLPNYTLVKGTCYCKLPLLHKSFHTFIFIQHSVRSNYFYNKWNGWGCQSTWRTKHDIATIR